MKSTEIFPIITEKLQRQFEKECKDTLDQTPDICGYYGRACRCLESEEGANRALCYGCPLSEFASERNTI